MPRDFSKDLRDSNLFDKFQAGQYEYSVNEEGGKTATGSLQLSDAVIRDGKAQTGAGGESRRGSDHQWGADDGGHLIGARFGGAPGEENLTAQNRNLNRSDYKSMENEWAAHLEAGDKVFVHIETDEGIRPNAYMGYVIYESPDGTRDYDFFHFNNESRAEQAKWEEALQELEAEQPVGFENDDGNYYIGIVEPETGAASSAADNDYLGSAVAQPANVSETVSMDNSAEAGNEMDVEQ